MTLALPMSSPITLDCTEPTATAPGPRVRLSAAASQAGVMSLCDRMKPALRAPQPHVRRSHMAKASCWSIAWKKGLSSKNQVAQDAAPRTRIVGQGQLRGSIKGMVNRAISTWSPGPTSR